MESMKTKLKFIVGSICCLTIICLLGIPMNATSTADGNQSEIGDIGVDITWIDFGGKYKNYRVQDIWGTDYYRISMWEDDDYNGFREAVLDGKGEVVIEPDDFEVSSSSSNDFSMTMLRKGNECYLISTEGFAKMDASPYSELSHFSDRYATVTLIANGHIGVIDTSGKLLFSTGEYKTLTHIGEGIFATAGDAGQDFYVSGYLLNTSGARINETFYDTVDYVVSEGMIKVSQKGKYGFVDISGNEIIPAMYEQVRYFNCGAASVKVNGKWGLIDKTGAEIVAPAYDDIYLFADTLCRVSVNNKYGVLNTAGELILPIEYADIHHVDYGAGDITFAAFKGGRAFLIDEAGNAILSGDYSYINTNPDGTISVRKIVNGKSVEANLDREGNNLTGYKEFSLYYLSESMLLGIKHGEYPPGVTPPHDYQRKVALFDTDGNNLTGFIYSNSGAFLNNYLIVSENYYQPVGLLNKYGAEVLPVIFDDIFLTDEGYAFIRISDIGTGSNSRVGLFKIPESFNEKKRTPFCEDRK